MSQIKDCVEIINQHIENFQPKVGLVLGSGLCLLYTSPSPRDATLSRMPSSA